MAANGYSQEAGETEPLTCPVPRWHGNAFANALVYKTYDCTTYGERWEAIRLPPATSLAVIGKSLGHKSQAATAVYARLNLEPVRVSVDTATAAILAAAKPKAKRRIEQEGG